MRSAVHRNVPWELGGERMAPAHHRTVHIASRSVCDVAVGRLGTAETATRLVGRDRELTAMSALVESARAGRSAVLVLHGDAGVGKSALLRTVVDYAHGFRLLSVAGLQSEITLGYAALQRMLLPVSDRIAALPPAQRAALETIFGLADHGSSDRFLVGLATLTLLTEVATNEPLCCVVDDAQWIDRESREVLGFVGRRLEADAIVLVLAMRDSHDLPPLADGLETLAVGTLDHDSARHLLLERAGRQVADDVVDRVVAEAAGLPLAIVEIARALTDEQSAGRAALPEYLPVGARLEQHYRAQVERLSSDAQLLLLVASAESTEDLALVRAAASLLGVSELAEEEAARSGLLSLDDGLGFRHPLVRSAVYSSAPGYDRRRVHLALADAIDVRVNADLRAWHRAAAAVKPDESVASELWASADAARARGGYAEEAVVRSRSAALTPDPQVRGRRLLAAAQAYLAGGAPHSVAALVEQAQPLLSDSGDIAEAQQLVARLDALRAPGSVPARLLEAARIAEPTDPETARAIYGHAVDAALVSFQFTTGTTPAEVGAAALRSLESRCDSDLATVVVEGFARRLSAGYAEAVPAFRRALHALRDDVAQAANLQGVAVLVNTLGYELWEEGAQYQLLRDLERRDRDARALETLRLRLEALTQYEIGRGNFESAAECHAEGLDIAVALGARARAWELNAIGLYAWRGDEQRVREYAAILLHEAMQSAGAGIMSNMARTAVIALAIARGQYREAFDHAWYLFEIDPPAGGNQALPDVIEAGVRCGEADAAEAALRRLELRATIAGTPWALGMLARSRALLADDGEAGRLYEAALLELSRTEVVVERARTHLLYGEWLRRRRRRADARDHLRRAFMMFDVMGAKAFADRAATELAATGERTRRRTVDTANDLTPQEARVARLAATGATNREIAAQLFISAATVEHHLHQVFRKLNVTSRHQLARQSGHMAAGEAR